MTIGINNIILHTNLNNTDIPLLLMTICIKLYSLNAKQSHQTFVLYNTITPEIQRIDHTF